MLATDSRKLSWHLLVLAPFIALLSSAITVILTFFCIRFVRLCSCGPGQLWYGELLALVMCLSRKLITNATRPLTLWGSLQQFAYLMLGACEISCCPFFPDISSSCVSLGLLSNDRFNHGRGSALYIFTVTMIATFKHFGWLQTSAIQPAVPRQGADQVGERVDDPIVVTQSHYTTVHPKTQPHSFQTPSRSSQIAEAQSQWRINPQSHELGETRNIGQHHHQFGGGYELQELEQTAVPRDAIQLP